MNKGDAEFIALAHNLMPLLLECYDLVLIVAYGNRELERTANDIRAQMEGDLP